MRICQISKFDPATGGGLESTVYGLIKLLEKSEHTLYVTYMSDVTKTFRKSNVVYRSFKTPNIPILATLYYSLIATWFCWKNNIELIHAHGEIGIVPAIYKAIKKDMIMVQTFQGLSLNALAVYQNKYWLLKIPVIIFKCITALMEALSGHLADTCHAVSHQVKIELSSSYKIPSNKIFVVHNAADSTRFYRTNYSRINKRKKILFVGKEGYRKGLFQFLKVANAFPEYDFVIIGPTTLKIARPNVRTRGKLSVGFMNYIYNSADLLILPSYYEGHPLTLMEACACGLPFIASKECNFELLTDQYTKFSACENDEKILISLTRELLNNKKLYEKYSKKLVIISKKYSDKVQYSKVVGHYEN